MQYAIEGGETNTIPICFFDSVDGTRNARAGSSNGKAWERDVTRFVESLYGAPRLAIRFQVYNVVLAAAFDLARLFSTPIQSNIERRGEYSERVN